MYPLDHRGAIIHFRRLLTFSEAQCKNFCRSSGEHGSYPDVSLDHRLQVLTLYLSALRIPLKHTYYECQQQSDSWQDPIYYHILIPVTV